MSVTLSDIAKAAGTSVSTVSRVLTGASGVRRISDETREKVTGVARELGYRPNLLARSLRTRKTKTVAVMVSDIANQWFGQLASHIEQSLHRSGFSTIVCNSGEDESLEREYLQLLPQKGIDGLIIVPLARKRGHIRRHLPESTPVVVVDRPIKGIAESITSDQHQAARLLCENLRRIGVRLIGLVKGPQHVFTHRIRAKAISSAFEVVDEVEGPAQKETGRSAWQRLSRAPVDAIVCTNNFLAQGLIESLSYGEFRGAIGCFDELPMMNLLPVPVVCSKQDVRQLAEGAVEMLLRRLEGQTMKPIVVPTMAVWNLAFEKKAAKESV